MMHVKADAAIYTAKCFGLLLIALECALQI
jgi:hypothetical protein